MRVYVCVSVIACACVGVGVRACVCTAIFGDVIFVAAVIVCV